MISAAIASQPLPLYTADGGRPQTQFLTQRGIEFSRSLQDHSSLLVGHFFNWITNAAFLLSQGIVFAGRQGEHVGGVDARTNTTQMMQVHPVSRTVDSFIVRTVSRSVLLDSIPLPVDRSLPNPARGLVSAIFRNVLMSDTTIVTSDVPHWVPECLLLSGVRLPSEFGLLTTPAHAKPGRIRGRNNHRVTPTSADTVQLASVTDLASSGSLADGLAAIDAGVTFRVRHFLTSYTGRGVRRAEGVTSTARHFRTPELYSLDKLKKAGFA